MGHGRCGGIAALIEHREPLSPADFVGGWVAGLRELRADTATELERRVVERSLGNLGTFPWVRERAAGGELELHGAWFDIALGELHVLSLGGWRRAAAAG
jgi:carbonic anhydrase